MSANEEEAKLSFLHGSVVDYVLKKNALSRLQSLGQSVPDIDGAVSNSWEQFKSYLSCPVNSSWTVLAESTAGVALSSFALQGNGVAIEKLRQAIDIWRNGFNPPPISKESGDWLWWSSRISLSEDMLAYALTEELSVGKFDRLRIVLRLDDSEEERKKEKTYRTRWRQFLAMLNYFQFSSNHSVFTTSEVNEGIAPEVAIDLGAGLSAEWKGIIEEAATSIEPLIRAMAAEACMVPKVEFYSDDVPEDAFAELAWSNPDSPIVLLIGDQAFYASKWADAGWKVLTDKDIAALGTASIITQLPKI